MPLNLEYIASGMGHTRFALSRSYQNNSVLDRIDKEVFAPIQGAHGHSYGILFNAHTEKKFGAAYDRFKSVSSVHADSGGLQVVTLGKMITDSLRQAVYEKQGKHSTVAMSFDEVPVVVNNRSVINDLNSKRFDKDNFDSYAKKSGYNLASQIEYFRTHGYKTKPMMIVQGNGIYWFQRWVEVLLKEVPIDMHCQIAGVSIAGTSIGNGLLEAIERAASVPVLPCEEDIKANVHLLGVGSIARLFPSAILYQTGYLNQNTHLSYDSTSHTMKLSNGSYLNSRGKLQLYGTTNVKVIEEYHRDIIRYFGDVGARFSLSDVVESLTTNSSKRSWDYFSSEDRVEQYHVFMVAAAFASIANFTYHVNSLFREESSLLKWLSREGQSILSTLLQVTDYNEFIKWSKTIGPKVHSQRLETKAANVSSLDDLFD